MVNEVEVKGKNLDEALLLAQKELNTTKENISYEIVEESNKTLFSILSPKYVVIKAKIIDEEKIQIKANSFKKENNERKIVLTDEEKEKVIVIAKEFLNDFFNTLKVDNNYTISFKDNILNIDIKSKDAKVLIGYRGEVLEALQTVITLVINNKMNSNIIIQLDIENYREKRKQVLIDLANKVAQSVIRTGKSISLEPMVAYERKVIHLTLQDNEKIETSSVGEEPYRKVVVKLKQ